MTTIPQIPMLVELTVKMLPTKEIAKATEIDKSREDNSQLFFSFFANASGVK
jgi:hypothetical protein